MSNPISILVINPNSSQSITDALKPLFADVVYASTTLTFYTAPPSAPSSIDDAETSAQSTRETLPDLRRFLAAHTGLPFSAYLIACYSDHPLTAALREESLVSGPVMNILESSVLHAKKLGRPFGVVTTGTYWEPVLDVAVRAVLEQEKRGIWEGEEVEFVGVYSTGLSALELHTTPRAEVDGRIARAAERLFGTGARIVLLGCAGMSGMEDAVRAGAGGDEDLVIINGVGVGVLLLEGLVRKKMLGGYA
ncbi:hypothetical protein BDW22DRAFT_1356100 [Trametopsis cervina]|nr:hypothetical protein BDW22DRAFT_1356100 [Trametopsis cervina]